MPTFAHDRDLLLLEPNLFRDIAWSAQTLVKGTATLAAGELTIDTTDLQSRGVAVGMVAVVAGIALEIVSFVSATRARVSLIRDDPAGPQRTPADLSVVQAVISTFNPQINIVHRQLLRTLGVELAGTTSPFPITTEDQIANPADLTFLETLGSLHLIYSAAAALLGDASPAALRAQMYADRFARERFRAVAKLDTNADGLPDATRRFNVLTLTRA